MAAQANGKAKKPKNSANGGLNGSADGHLNGHANGYADKTSSGTSLSVQKRRSGKTMTGTFTSIVARLTTWYLIITLLFRCPSSLSQLDASSPKVCKPYLQTRSYAAPYFDPYYNHYVSPQLQKVKPYTDRFQSQIYDPAATFTKDKYATYGAHRVENARAYAEAQYDKSIRPQLQVAQGKMKTQYDQYLGPHVKTATDVTGPYYNQVLESLDEIYHLSILPAYEASLPYLRQAHAQGHHVLVDIVFPHVQAARDTTWAFLVRTVWPQLRILYGDNVEPQLVRISERLGRYRDQRKVESVFDAAESQTWQESKPVGTTAESIIETSTEVPTSSVASSVSASISAESPSASTKGGWGLLDDFFGKDASSQTASDSPSKVAEVEAPKLTGAELKAKLNDDLRKWQTKFAVAADKGAEDLDQRVEEITSRQVSQAVKGHGQALVTLLEETADSTIKNLKNHIKTAVKSTSDESSEEELNAAYDECNAKTREFGLKVKDKAQDVRAWKAAYDHETDSLVKAAVQSTVDVLQRIHSLGLQEVGMRWAWTDGVTYKDWQNYHKLRATLNEWQAEVEAVGSRHEGLRVAHEEAKKLEDQAMTIASNMVSELVRLKDVSKWKIWAGDASDDFSDKAVPARVFKVAEQVKDQATDAASDIKEDVEAVVSDVSEAVAGSSTPISESVASSAEELVSEATSGASEVVQKGSSTAIDVASSVDEFISEASSEASQAVIGTPSSDILSEASEAILGTSSSDVLSEASRAADEVVSEASSVYDSPPVVFGGANAQIIAEAKEIIFDEPLDDDDDETYAEKAQEILADAGDRAAELSRAVSEALLGHAKTQGTVESATSLAADQYSRAAAAASSILYGTEQAPLESATSVASEKFAQAVTAASYAIYGTPTPTAIISTIHIEAKSRYTNAISQASEQLENAKSQLSVLISGTPKPVHETMLSYFEKAYSDSVAVAQERLEAALQYTDSIKSYAAGPTQGYFESVSSIASVRLSEGLNQASAYLSQPTGVADNAQQQYYQAVGLAHARYSEFVNAASTAVYGSKEGTAESLASVASASAASAASVVAEAAGSAVTNAQAAAQSVASQVSSGVIGSETPWTESVASQASENWASLIAQASSQVYGKPTPWAESVYSQAGVYGAQATAGVAEQYAHVQALISELVIGKEPDFTESVMNRFSSAYYTGMPAVVASASSYASEQFEAASSVAGSGYEAVTDAAADAYTSASSVVQAVFTPPAMIEDVLSQASASIDLAVESASIALYGTPKGAAEEASSSVASAYSSIQSQVSVQVYGTQHAMDSFSSAAISAQAAISEAIFGTPTAGDYVASATQVAGDAYAAVSSAASANAEYIASGASENAAYASSVISSAIWGPEQGAMESANSRIAAAVEVANSRIAEMYAAAAKSAEAAASSVASAASAATQRAKDEL